MIQESVECKRIGNEYVDLFGKLLQYIHYTKLSTDFITDDDLKMLSELEFYISSGKYEIIEFGTRKSPFDVREKIKDLEEELKELKDDYSIVVTGYKKLQKENKKLKSAMQDTYDSANDTCGELQQRIDKAIEYIQNNELVFELSSKRQIEEWFDMFYRDLLDILRGSE